MTNGNDNEQRPSPAADGNIILTLDTVDMSHEERGDNHNHQIL